MVDSVTMATEADRAARVDEYPAAPNYVVPAGMRFEVAPGAMCDLHPGVAGDRREWRRAIKPRHQR
eukprot:scaffold58606_cov64-Phaeocystis_antarctica.AAC.3